MFIYAKDCNKNVWKVTGLFSFCTYFEFQNDRHLDSKMPSVFNIFWPISLLLGYLESAK